MFGIILADISMHEGDYKQGLLDIEKSISLLLEKNEQCYMPEQLVMRGRLQLLLEQADKAYQNFNEANIKARDMGSLAGELKACYQLATFYCLQNKPLEARRVLTPVVLRYVETENFVDLVSARKLLASL